MPCHAMLRCAVLCCKSIGTDTSPAVKTGPGKQKKLMRSLGRTVPYKSTASAVRALVGA